MIYKERFPTSGNDKKCMPHLSLYVIFIFATFLRKNHLFSIPIEGLSIRRLSIHHDFILQVKYFTGIKEMLNFG